MQVSKKTTTATLHVCRLREPPNSNFKYCIAFVSCKEKTYKHCKVSSNFYCGNHERLEHLQKKVKLQAVTCQSKQLRWVKADTHLSSFSLSLSSDVSTLLKSNGTDLKVLKTNWTLLTKAKWLNDYSQLQPNLPSSKNVALLLTRNGKCLKENRQKSCWFVQSNTYSQQKQKQMSGCLSLYQICFTCTEKERAGS